MKNLFVFLSAIVFISCTKENQDLSIDDASEINNQLIQTYYYKGESYQLTFSENEDGDIELLSDLPEPLNKLKNNPELAILFEADGIYLFENEESKFAFQNLDYQSILASRNEKKQTENYGSSARLVSVVTPSLFNNNVRCFQDSYFGGNVMSITSLSQLKNLKNVSFNDKISSLRISPSFITPLSYLPRFRKVICYEHADFRGISIDFSSSFYFQDYSYYGHRRLKSLSVAMFKNFNDRISSIDILEGSSSIVR